MVAPDFCKKCGAFIPSWADKCLACGEKPPLSINHPNLSDGDINLGPLLLNRATNTRVVFGSNVLRNAKIIDNYIERVETPVCGRTLDGRICRGGKGKTILHLTIEGEIE